MRKVVVFSLATGLLVILAALRGNDVWSSRVETLHRAETRVASDAIVLAEYVSGAFAAGDAALRQLALHSRRVGGPEASEGEWTPALASAGAGLHGIGSINIVDRAFVIRHSNRPALRNQSRDGDPTLNAAAASGAADLLIIGPPFKAPTFGQYVIPIARTLKGAGDAPDGFVVASFLPADLQRFFQSISVGARGHLSVFHTSGAIIVQEPSASDQMGETTEGNAIYEAAAAGANEGIVNGPVTPGSRVMIAGWRRVADLPLIVAVSLDQGEVLAPWRREVRGFFTTYSIVSVVVLGVLLVLFRQMDAKAAAERELQAARHAEAERLRATNEQLTTLLEREQQARREAEDANALKDQFVMTVSHELRTPLTAIAGWARMLVDGMVGEDRREGALRTIERNAQAQKRLIEDLLDIAGIMAGKLRLDVRPIVVADVMRMAVEAIAPASDAKGVHLETHIDPNAGTIAADHGRLQQIVWNLLSNAVKFTPAGGTVSLSVLRTERALTITVRDTGIGIGPDLLPHVFERFRQGSAGSVRRQGGLGLGLAIAKNLVELHGGTVTATSGGEGHGSQFEVILPLIESRRHA